MEHGGRGESAFSKCDRIDHVGSAGTKGSASDIRHSERAKAGALARDIVARVNAQCGTRRAGLVARISAFLFASAFKIRAGLRGTCCFIRAAPPRTPNLNIDN